MNLHSTIKGITSCLVRRLFSIVINSTLRLISFLLHFSRDTRSRIILLRTLCLSSDRNQRPATRTDPVRRGYCNTLFDIHLLVDGQFWNIHNTSSLFGYDNYVFLFHWQFVCRAILHFHLHILCLQSNLNFTVLHVLYTNKIVLCFCQSFFLPIDSDIRTGIWLRSLSAFSFIASVKRPEWFYAGGLPQLIWVHYYTTHLFPVSSCIGRELVHFLSRVPH